MKKKSILSIISGLFLSGCGLADNYFALWLIEPKNEYVNFPLGKNNKIEIEFSHRFSARYTLSLQTTHINIKERLNFDKNWKYTKENSDEWYKKVKSSEWFDYTQQYPYHFIATGYKVENGINKQIFYEIFTEKTYQNKRLGANGGCNPYKNICEFSINLKHFKLPAGKYKFIIQDYSEYIAEYENMENAISIHFDKRK